MPTATGQLTVSILGTEVVVDVEAKYRVTSLGHPAQLHGPPERCYEGEPPEFELDPAPFITCRIDGQRFPVDVRNVSMKNLDKICDMVYQDIEKDNTK